MILVFDSECIANPELPSDKEFPAPPHWLVVCIGVLVLDDDYNVRRLTVVPGDEREQIAHFVDLLNTRKPWLVGFNTRGYDLPVIAARAFAYGLPFPGYYQRRHRFASHVHLDLLDYLTDYGSAPRSKLDAWAKLCGFPGKGAVSGKDVQVFHDAGRIDEIRDYCKDDVIQTAAVFVRLQLCRGEISRETHDRCFEQLRAFKTWPNEEEKEND